MSNFDTARDALEVSLSSSGSAMEEHAKWSESIEARLLKLKATWQSFAQTFMKSSTLKVGISALSGLVNILEKLIDNFGLLGTIGLGVATKNLISYIKHTKAATAATTEKAAATKASTAAEVAEAQANIVSAQTEKQEVVANTQSALSEAKESLENVKATTTEEAEALANAKAALAEAQETIANLEAVASEEAEAVANAKAALAEAAETLENLKAVAAEDAETVANVKAKIAEAQETLQNFAAAGSEASGTMANVGAAAGKASKGFKAFATSTVGVVTGIGLAVAAIALIINAYKNYREEISQARQETIEASSAFLDSATSFEKAYIKYSGRTDLTAEEEADLESAIQGTVDALGDKSSALQQVVNNSNDYIASLESITDAELKAAKKAAQEKQKNAKLELEDATKDWYTDNTARFQIKNDSTALKIAQEMDTDFLQKEIKGKKGYHVSTYWFDMPSDADADKILDYYYTLVEYKNKLLEVDDFDTNKDVQSAYEEVNTIIEKLSDTVKVYEDGLYDLGKAEYEAQKGIPKTTEEYLKMREAILTREDIAKTSFDTRLSILNSLDSDYSEVFDLSSAEAQARKFVGIIKDYGDGTKDGTNEIGTVETFLNMRTAVNNNECTVGKYLSEFNNITSMSEKFSDKEKEQFNLAFGLDTDSIKKQYDDVYKYLSRNYLNKDTRNMSRDEEYYYKLDVREYQKKIEGFLNELSASELSALVSIKGEIDWETADIEDIRKQIKDEAKLQDALRFEASIEVDKTALELLNTVLEESASAMGLSTESIDALESKYSELESYNPHTLFEKTANGVKVNREELSKLEQEYNNLTKTEVKEHLETLANAYNDVTAEIDKCTNVGERAELLAKRETYASQIEELATYEAQLEGVTGAYQRWLNAQNGSENYEGYEGIATNKEDIQDEIDRGFIGNATKEYIDLLSGENLTGGTIDDYADAWGKLGEKVTSTGYSVKDFFTVNDDGDITSTGIDRFFESIKTDIEGIYNADTGVYDFSEDNLKKIQDEYGMGIEAIELLLEAAESAGYDVDWGGIFDDIDLDTSNFESLVSVAEKAQKELNKLEGYEDLDFNFSTTNVEAATTELNKAQKTYNELVTNDDGTININAKGADKARVILATLLVQKQQLEDSEIAINISTTGLDDSQAKAVAWVQDFRTKYKNLEIAISTGEGIEEAKTELETVKTSLGELDGDTAKIAAQLVLGEGTDTDGAGFKTQVSDAINAIGDQDINVGFKLNETAISDLNSQLLTNFTVDATAKITNVDKSQLETVETGGMVTWDENTDGVSKSFEADGKVNWSDGLKDITTSFSANGTVNWTSGNNVEVKVISEANGTANANGTASGKAFRQGDWGIKGSGTALVGELGMETLVRGGKFYTIGNSGAEFIQYRPNDIIFNHKQTEELFKYGKVLSDGGRGNVYANGSAFAEGNYPSNGKAFWKASAYSSRFAERKLKDGEVKSNTKTKTEEDKDSVTTTTTTTWEADAKESDFAKKNRELLSPSSSSSSSADEFEETIDWIEVAIDRIERAIDRLDTKANSVYRTWSERNENLVAEIGKVEDEIALQEKAYDRYIQEANSVGLSSSWAEKVRNGEVDIETIKDEALAEKIKDYQQW